MQKILLSLLFCASLIVSSQNIKIKDFQLVPLSIFHASKKQDALSNGGLHLGIDTGFIFFNQNLRLQLNTGSDISILGSSSDRYSSVNLLYELNPNLFNWMKTEVYCGTGLMYVSYKNYPSISVNDTYFNLPLGTRLMFFSNNRIALGLQFQTEFNADNTTLTYSSVFRYNFKSNSKTSNQ